MFVRYSSFDEPETMFRQTVEAACRFLWILEVPEQALAALYDVVESACGEEGPRAALESRLLGGAPT